MPEYHLSVSGERAHPFHTLDEFARGYVEAAFFTNGDCGDDDEFCISDRDVESLHPDAVQQIAAYCADFQSLGRVLLERAYASGEYDAEQAGRDLWFTANGHGVGYWDRDELESEGIGDALSELAREMGERSLYVGDDNRVHVA